MGGTRWKEPGKLLDPTGKHRNNNSKMEAVFRSYVLGFVPVTSWSFPARNSLEDGHKSSKHVSHVKKCRPVPVGKHWKSIRKMEAVFQPENLRIFPEEFRPFTGEFRQFLDEFRSFPHEVRHFFVNFRRTRPENHQIFPGGIRSFPDK